MTFTVDAPEPRVRFPDHVSVWSTRGRDGMARLVHRDTWRAVYECDAALIEDGETRGAFARTGTRAHPVMVLVGVEVDEPERSLC